MPSIEFRHVSKHYGPVKALDDVSLSLLDNEYTVLLGPSGCGKTTLLKSLAGVLELSAGQVLVDGVDISAVPPEDRLIGMVFQNYALFPHLTVLQNAMYGPLARGEPFVPTEKTAHEMLEMVRLSARHDALPKELSGGMQQRVALARALSTGSRILLLDEPLSALDARVKADLRLEMRKMVKELGLTAIHVTHDQEEAMVIADRIVVMRKGRIEQVGTPDEIYFSPASLFVASFVGEASFLVGRMHGRTLHVLDTKVQLPRAREGRTVVAVRPEHVRLAKGGTGVVKSARMIGGYYRHEIELNGELVIAKSLARFSGNVRVGIEPARINLFAYPEEGIARATAVD